uniref:Putative ovule protein n=1 Tax=Solanum chacoense TaxID=4108 RepID=A0A0V0IGU5_SOLCH
MLKLVLYNHVYIHTYKSIRDQNQHIRNLHQIGTVEEITGIKKGLLSRLDSKKNEVNNSSSQ